MIYRGLITGLGILVAVAATVGAGWWLVTHEPKTAEKSSRKPPATVTVNEAQLNVISLTSDALARLALSTGQIERKPMTVSRSLGGEVFIPPGQTIIVSAPVNGVLKAPPSGVLHAGQAIQKRATVFELLPLLTPENRANLTTALIDAIGQVKSTEVQREAGQIAYDRAKRVFESEAGPRRAVDEALAQKRVAEEAHAAAVARQNQLERLIGDTNSGTAAPLTIESPREGIIRTFNALPEQQVPAGAPLFEVAELSSLWVKVPIFVGDYHQFDATAEATITELTAKPGTSGINVQRIDAPPSADPLAATVDIYFQLDNKEMRYRPGERVAAQLTTQGSRDSLTVPWSAVIYDVYGGTWIYERTGDLTFVRRRVVVRNVQRDVAVLDAGPPPGTVIVTAGAAELFGTEMGFTK